jgi:tRNA (guanine37-N1)-methyltransferase
VLRSGDHGRVASWRRAQALRRTLELRPDLVERRGGLTAEDRELLEAHPRDEPWAAGEAAERGPG